MPGLKHYLERIWHGSEVRASPENPSTNLSDSASWLVEAMGGGIGATGRAVTPESAMRLSAVYACVRVIAEDIASLPLCVYEPLDRGKRKASDLVEWGVLHDAPNSLLTSFQWREMSMAHVLLWGGAYAEIETNRRGDVIGLWPCAPWGTRPRYVDNHTRIVYDVTLPGGRVTTLPAEKMLHIPGLSFDGLCGISVISSARNAAGLGMAAEEFGARFFGNSSRPSGYLKVPPGVKKDDARAVLNAWNDSNQGLDNAARTAMLLNGAEWQKMGLTNDEAQFLETRKFQVTEIARMFRVPPHMIADLERATFSNIEHQALQYVVHTLRPWLVRIEQELNRKLFAGRNLCAEFSVQGLLRGDIKARSDYYVKGRQWGWLSANDIRDLENMNPIDGGDTYLTPLNMVDAAAAHEPGAAKDGNEDAGDGTDAANGEDGGAGKGSQDDPSHQKNEDQQS